VSGSINLTTGEHSDVDPGIYVAPLILEPEGVVFEVVFWSTRFESWIVVVAERTGRTWPPEAKTREVAAPEMDYYRAHLGG